jgi:hypothetical protein
MLSWRVWLKVASEFSPCGSEVTRSAMWRTTLDFFAWFQGHVSPKVAAWLAGADNHACAASVVNSHSNAHGDLPARLFGKLLHGLVSTRPG